MGNILESDTSSSSDTDESRLREETRTQGDGMESDISALNKGNINSHLEGKMSKVITFVQAVDGKSAAEQVQRVSSRVYDEDKPLATAAEFPKLRLGERESPKQLPPRDQLIILKPTKMVEKIATENYNVSYHKPMSASNKQREPKFVPYEPYKGATRSMTEDSTKTHSRKPSSGSTNSVASVGTTKLESGGAKKVPPIKLQDNSIATSHSNAHYTPKVSEGEVNWNQGHVVMLLKERLKMHEKDVNELRTENIRLKKMLVDSMSGFGSTSNVEIPSSGDSAKYSLNAKGHSMSESVDNLTDEIEVWRSKFLSSCVVVEQLMKQNHDWKGSVNSAADLFRETKQCTEVVLTPHLFDKINTWLQQNHYSRDSRSPAGGRNISSSILYDNDENDYGSDDVSIS